MGTGRQQVVCGVDIGSTNIKVVAMDRDGLVVARGRRSTPRDPRDQSIAADDLFDEIEDLIVGICGSRFIVAAISVAGVGEDGILADELLEPITGALAWFDPRRQHLYHQLEDHLAPAHLGVVTDPARTLVGWHWARQQVDTTTAARDGSGGDTAAAHWIALTDYAAVRWSGVPFISDTLAARTAAWDINGRSWLADRVLLTLGDTDLLPPVVRTGDIVGALRSHRLSAAGLLAADALVVAGGHDHPVGGWGVSLRYPDAILDSMGTAEVVVAQSPHAGLTRTDNIDLAPGIRSSGTTLLRVEELARNVEWASQSPAVGAALDRLISGVDQPDRYLDSDCFVAGSAGGGRPRYLAGTPADPVSRASAVLGALARLGNEAITAVRSQMPDGARVLAAGGWARSPGWVDIKTKISNSAAIVIAEPEVTATGAALLAADGLGWHVSPENALSGFGL